MTPALVQRIWPYVAALLVAVGMAVVVLRCSLGPFPIALPAATMTFGVVVSGFVATQRNMLLTMSGAEVLAFAVSRGYHRDVLAYLMDGIRAGLLVTSISLFGFFIGSNSTLWAVWLCSLAGGVALVVCLIARNEILITRMVEHYLEDQGTSPRH